MKVSELKRYHGISSWETRRRSRKGNFVLTWETVNAYPYEGGTVFGGPGDVVMTWGWVVVHRYTGTVLAYDVQRDEYGY